ncbi:UPF0769 protein C21orf59-like isoform X2 [Limulus polyphemus]|uniref:UPF0769 protein C21orf59-like isoform X2 n=1 Tax=Limulus polyphemus TaxID=6850 RepID=A0ABM1BAJ8_LIMPO|nr:UPF0769 protein C21orf59-like isoform X2 [Limulus polyphemus]
MVKLHIKKGNESQFLHETTVDVEISELLKDVVAIYNGRLKVGRICTEMEDLAKHGTMLPPNMQGLTDEQVIELKLKDEWGEKCIPSGGFVENKDTIGRRNGKAPNQKMAEVLTKTLSEAKAKVSKKQIEANVCLSQTMVKEALDILQGAVMIVYPMGLPPHEPIKKELDNEEDLSGTQAFLDVLEVTQTQLWWAGKELEVGKKLANYVGKNEKTKIVAKLQKIGQGAPAREPVMSEEEQKRMMLYAYRKQEEMKKLEDNDEDDYMNSDWADNSLLKRSFHGMKDVKWKPR